MMDIRIVKNACSQLFQMLTPEFLYEDLKEYTKALYRSIKVNRQQGTLQCFLYFYKN